MWAVALNFRSIFRSSVEVCNRVVLEKSCTERKGGVRLKGRKSVDTSYVGSTFYWNAR